MGGLDSSEHLLRQLFRAGLLVTSLLCFRVIHRLVIVISQIPHDINFQLAPFCFENFAIGICQIETQTHTHNDDKDCGDDNVDDDDYDDDDDDGVEDDSQGMNYKSGAFAQ